MLNAGLGYEFIASALHVSLDQKIFWNTDDVPTTSATFVSESLPSYRRTDMNIVKTLNRQLQGTLQIRNLFDRNNRLPSPTGSRGGLPDDPRSVNIGLQYQF
jgi:iron complex outermembrane receptor protein